MSHVGLEYPTLGTVESGMGPLKLQGQANSGSVLCTFHAWLWKSPRPKGFLWNRSKRAAHGHPHPQHQTGHKCIVSLWVMPPVSPLTQCNTAQALFQIGFLYGYGITPSHPMHPEAWFSHGKIIVLLPTDWFLYGSCFKKTIHKVEHVCDTDRAVETSLCWREVCCSGACLPSRRRRSSPYKTNPPGPVGNRIILSSGTVSY